MSVTQRLDLRQSQSLVMTPQLQQAIKLLELSNLELADFVERELEINPLLERDDDFRSADSSELPADEVDWGTAGVSFGEEGEGGAVDAASFAQSEVLPSEGSSPLDTDYDNLWDSGGSGADVGLQRSATSGGAPDEDYSAEDRLTGEVSLRDHLLSQVGSTLSDPVDRFIGQHLVDLVDDAGYLTADLTEVAEQLGCSPERAEGVLEVLQQFEPTGIFARSLAECLALQLKERNRLDPAMQTLLRNLPLLASRDRGALMRLCGVDAEDLADMVAEIRALNPKPALGFGAEPAPPPAPDIVMVRHPAGGWHVELNPETLPRVLVNNAYATRVSKQVKAKAERDYMAERLQSANWLVRSLHQRATTILKVAAEIVRRQDAFFRHGVQHLKPLIRRDIAEAIGMHESTVSRVTTNKYIATPRGLFELRYFFTAALAHTSGGDGHSAEAVRARLKQMIDSEEEVLSDDQLVARMQREGIEIARRTIAKYRESLNIPSSVERRRERSLRRA